MVRQLGAPALVAWCVAVSFVGTSASASAPAPPRNCGAPVVGTPVNAMSTPLTDNGVTTSLLPVSGLAATIGDVDVLTTITHPHSAQLDVTLTSPAGTVVTLTTDNGSTFDNVFAGTLWDDDAAPDGVPAATSAPVPGHAQLHSYVNGGTATPLAPEEALGALIGENPNGVWTLRVSDDQAGETGTLSSWGLDIQSLPATPPVVGGSSYPEALAMAIPSGSASVTTDTVLAFAEAPYLGDVDVTTNITHSRADDLQIALTSPAGTTVFLATGVMSSAADGGADNVFAGTLFDDDANPGGQIPYVSNAGLAADHPFANLTLASPLAPPEALAAFRGENPNGLWTLTVADQFAGEGGTLSGWTLLLRPAACSVPDTAIDTGPGPTPGASSTPRPAAGGARPGLPVQPFTPSTSSPSIAAFAVTPTRPRAGKALTFRWRLSRAATVTVVVERLVKRKFKRLGRVTKAANAGAGSLKLNGRIGRTKLPAGRYRATITATAPGVARASAAQTVRFTILRR